MDAPTLAAGTTVGRYTIRELLGAGGMGEVYAAWDGPLERNVALKILPRDLMRDPRRVQRFVNEAKAASALSHPSIVTIHDAGEESGLHFIAMELVEGATLDEWLRREPPLSSILTELAAVAEGLARAHARGIVHRDLKPDNIMVNADGHAKVLDFGVARLLDVEQEPARTPSGRRTVTGTILGTPGYIAPEQIEGRPVDHRSDIFSFGCILYEAITGRAPFLGATNAETIHNIVHGRPPLISVGDANLREALQRIIDRCLAKEPDARYDSAHDLSLDLMHALSGGPALAIRGTARRTRLRRGAAVAAAIGVAGVFLLVPAGAIVNSISPSRNREVHRLEELLAAERQQNDVAAAALTEREKEIARRGTEIERLRGEREQSERLRSDLEASYRRLLSDVEADLRKDKSERTQLRERVASAEAELQRFRDEQQRRQRQQERIAAIQKELSPVVEARIEDRGLVLTIPGAFFGTEEGRIRRGSDGILRNIAAQLVANPDLRVVIEGHTDDRGPAGVNMALSLERAESIRDALVLHGVGPARVTCSGRGEAFPLFSNDFAEGRIRNRRAELILAY